VSTWWLPTLSASPPFEGLVRQRQLDTAERLAFDFASQASQAPPRNVRPTRRQTDAKIEELKQRAKDTGPGMLPTIELPIVTYKARL